MTWMVPSTRTGQAMTMGPRRARGSAARKTLRRRGIAAGWAGPSSVRGRTRDGMVMMANAPHSGLQTSLSWE